MAKFTLTQRQVSGVTLIDAAGKLAWPEGTDHVKKQVGELMVAGSKRIILNLKEVSLIDSTGIGELVACNIHAKKQGGRLALLHLTSRNRELMDMMMLLTSFATYEDEAEAVRAMAAD